MIRMGMYKGKLMKTEPVYGEAEGQIIEMWATFEVEGYEIEVFLDNFYVVPRKDLLEGVGKDFNLNLVLMAYDILRINIEEKMLKQITKYPGEDKYGRAWPSIPIYFIMGEIKEVERIKKEWRGREIETYRILVDCGLIVETEVRVDKIDELYRGDYVVIIGKMFGEIVKEGDVDALPEEEKYE